ncbi:MAG TPA: Uma2 family endonuclease, partial [Allocoleopsis sp.]
MVQQISPPIPKTVNEIINPEIDISPDDSNYFQEEQGIKIITTKPDFNIEESNYYVPDAESLITEDDTAVDNWISEKQQRFLSRVLYNEWTDKVFLSGANVGIYYQDKMPAIIPDVFISLDVQVPENYWEKKHRCYLTWEFGKVPELAIEIVSNKIGDELGEKKRIYQKMKVNYYVVFDPNKFLGEQVLSIYELHRGRYVEKTDNWLEELDLGLTLWDGEFEQLTTTWLRWCDRSGNILLTGQETAVKERNRANLAEERANLAEQKAQLLA